jgi:hypothetical protein
MEKLEITLGEDEKMAIAQVAEEMGLDMEAAIHELILRGYGQWRSEKSIRAMQRNSESYRKAHPITSENRIGKP